MATEFKRESDAINHWLWRERKDGAKDDDKAGRLIGRLADLERTTPLNRRKAIRDLDDSAMNHVQPCRCDKCDHEKVCKHG